MSRLSLSDWYRYLESQFVEGERKAREEPPPSPAASTESEPTSSEPEVSGEAQIADGMTETSQGEARVSPHLAEEAYAVISIRVPHFLAFVPLLREELGLPPTAVPRHTLEDEPLNEPSKRVDEASAEPKTAVPESVPTNREQATSEPAARLRKHRPKRTPDPEQLIPPEMDEMWAKLPRYLRYLVEWSDDAVTDKYYPTRGRESREELIARLTDPVLTLEEVARLLGVCPATVRRYTNRGWLRHFRTEGNQRRFRLSDIVAFLEEQIHRVPQSPRSSRNERARQGRSKRSQGLSRTIE
ncbi:hypothetical protein HRbin15_01406 [bacterium HR15]|nr:hypothetical protein HRbin15_01406 [bacterium HR15]